MQYRRTDITGASYFFTANMAERHQRLSEFLEVPLNRNVLE